MGFIIAITGSEGSTKFVRAINGNLNTRRFDVSITSEREEAFVEEDLEFCKQKARCLRECGFDIRIFRAVAGTSSRGARRSKMKTQINYRSQLCWPDLEDLRRVVGRMGLQAEPKKIYQDFRALYEWFRIIKRFCHSHGKHGFIAASEILRLAETFIGRKLNENAFRAAVDLFHFKVRGERKPLDSMFVKVPDLGRIEEASDFYKH